MALAGVMPVLSGNLDHQSNVAARLLAAHNRERAAVGAPELAWDDALAVEARAAAQRIARTGSFDHGGPRLSGRGENLWEGTRGAYAPEEMTGLWAAEKADFQHGVFPQVSRSRNLAAVGHYTQMIWRGTKRVGCALADDGRDDILVCRYAAPGNITGERPI
jgi:hypothetical protein